MATTFTIESVYYANPASVAQTMKFEYKRWDEPESYYILLDAAAPVEIDGTLLYPILVTGVTPGQIYFVRQTNNCHSPAMPVIQEIPIPS